MALGSPLTLATPSATDTTYPTVSASESGLPPLEAATQRGCDVVCGYQDVGHRTFSSLHRVWHHLVGYRFLMLSQALQPPPHRSVDHCVTDGGG